jgi:glyceraldehyde-3-phosphate dehydrogenase (NAD(P))
MHVHAVFAKLRKPCVTDDVRNMLRNTTRILLLNGADGFQSSAQIIDYFRDVGRYRYDIPELVIWEESISVKSGEVAFIQAVHNEAIVVPENIDAIRAMFNLCDAKTSIEKTNKSFGIK